jgi:hypothetical protein
MSSFLVSRIICIPNILNFTFKTESVSLQSFLGPSNSGKKFLNTLKQKFSRGKNCYYTKVFIILFASGGQTRVPDRAGVNFINNPRMSSFFNSRFILILQAHGIVYSVKVGRNFKLSVLVKLLNPIFTDCQSNPNPLEVDD